MGSTPIGATYLIVIVSIKVTSVNLIKLLLTIANYAFLGIVRLPLYLIQHSLLLDFGSVAQLDRATAF